MNHQSTFDHIHDIAESLESMSDLVYKMLMEYHFHLKDAHTIYNIEDTMGQVLAMKLLAQDLDSSLPNPMDL